MRNAQCEMRNLGRSQEIGFRSYWLWIILECNAVRHYLLVEFYHPSLFFLMPLGINKA